jgi:hypothetical protein
MKKIFLISLAILLICVALAFAGETKIISDKNAGLTITVPEQAPEFFNWDATITASEVYPNGNSLSTVQSVSPDERVGVISLWCKKAGKVYLIAFAVFYANKKGAEPECYEDLGFIKTGTATGIFTRVDKADPTSVFRNHLVRIEI